MDERLSRNFQDRAKAEGFDVQALSQQAWLAQAGGLPVAIKSLGAWRLVGDVFEAGAPRADEFDEPRSHPFDADVWGRYVGLKLNVNGQIVSAYRDPSGALDAIVWFAHGLTFIASEPPDWLVATVRPRWRIAYDRIPAALVDPVLASDELLLEDVRSLLPGALIDLPDGDPLMMWRPAQVARHGLAHQRSNSEAARLLRRTVEHTVGCLAGAGGVVAAEVSGGFDSSVVAACLAGTSKADIRLWLNAYGPDAAGDERRYVEALAQELGIEASFAVRRDEPLSLDWLERMPQGVRPSLAALDGPHDADWARRLLLSGAQSLFTGKGGDALFVQPMTQAVFTDLWMKRPWRAMSSPGLVRIARHTEQSVWTLVRDAIAHQSVPPPLDAVPTDLFPRPTCALGHPWLEDFTGLGPAKAYQIMGLAHGLTVYGQSLKTETVEPVHPLLAQPIVEVCLGLPIEQLTLMRRDRALARRAFADRLPPLICNRRSKGELSGYFGRMIADGLGAVRPWLLEGRLAAEGLINRTAFENLLQRDSLAWRGGYVEVLTAIAFEGWIRAWEARLQHRSTSPQNSHPES